MCVYKIKMRNALKCTIWKIFKLIMKPNTSAQLNIFLEDYLVGNL